MDPKKLDKAKRKLRKVYESGTGPVSISVNVAMEVFLWCAHAEDPLALTWNILPVKSAVYVAYESKIGRPTAGELSVSLEFDGNSIGFESEEGKVDKCWERSFRGIYVRAVEHGDLPCEDFSSCCLHAPKKVRDFRVIGRAKFSEQYHFEPMRLTLKAT